MTRHGQKSALAPNLQVLLCWLFLSPLIGLSSFSKHVSGAEILGRVAELQMELEKDFVSFVDKSSIGSTRGLCAGKDAQALAAVNEVLQMSSNRLYEIWRDVYGLNNTYPPADINLGSEANESASIPWAPHLEECSFREAQRQVLETVDYASWACIEQNTTGNLSMCNHPRPPWIDGADEDNLPLTRIVQRDIWVRQFLTNCSDPSTKFVLASWPNPGDHGLGSSLHLMTIIMSEALAANRVFVVADAFSRANHQACADLNKSSSLDCYFFPSTSAECKRAAKQALEEQKTVASDPPRVLTPSYFYHECEASGADIWAKDPAFYPTFAMNRKASKSYDRYKVTWFRSQAIRFLLRWPSAYLCHITNKARHEVYGMEVAMDLLKTRAGKEAATRAMPATELSFLTQRNTRDDLLVERTLEWRLKRACYLPRRIISMHVRQGDKVKEMQLMGFDAFMRAAYETRLLDPDVKLIWLSTEMADIVNATSNYSDWKFYYTQGFRQDKTTRMADYEMLRGLEEHVGSSLANLLISAECDYFVGTLGSNWNRLINEFRLTNGRGKTTYMALNVGEY